MVLKGRICHVVKWQIQLAVLTVSANVNPILAKKISRIEYLIDYANFIELITYLNEQLLPDVIRLVIKYFTQLSRQTETIVLFLFDEKIDQ